MSASILTRRDRIRRTTVIAVLAALNTVWCSSPSALSADFARSKATCFDAASAQPSNEKLLQDLADGNRETWDAAIEQLGKRKSAVPLLSRAATDRTRSNRARWGAVLALARINDPKSTDLFIKLLKDDYQVIRGAACGRLSQIGGKRAADAILGYLRWSVEKKKRSDIIRATEAQRELPDKRALPLLLKCLEQQHDPYGYVARALGKLGDPSASELLARQLRVNVGYVHSRDYLYLNAIKVTKGRKAAPLLVEYLRKLVVKMKGRNIQTLHKPPFGLRGSKNRQMATDRGNYKRTVSAMEAVSGKKSVGGTREEVAEFWSKWLRSEYQAK